MPIEPVVICSSQSYKSLEKAEKSGEKGAEISNGICSFGVIRNQSVEKRSKTLSCCVKLCIIGEGVMTPLKQAIKEM